MSNRIYIENLKEATGNIVTIKGFAGTVRDQNKIVFIIVRDISGEIQCVVLKDCADFETAKSLSEESVVEIIGLLKNEPQAPGGIEIEVQNLKVLSKADPELPIPVNVKKGGEETNPSTRFDYRWIDIRKPNKTKIFKAWTSLERGLRKYYEDAKYTQIYTPSLMNTASETGADVFEVKYFDRLAYLAQSPQFYKQMAISSGLDRVFMTGPVFRAEESFTTRHLTEFTGWDFEIGYVDSHFDVMEEEENMLVSAISKLKQDLPEIDIDIPKTPFPKLTLKEVKFKLAEAGVPSEKEGDLSPEEERAICKIIKEEENHDFIFVTDYPITVRPFYHMRHENDPTLTKSADLLFKGIEITTLAQREHRYDILKAQAIDKGMNLEELDSYLNFFKFGCPPHGGGGVGPSRLIMKILGYENVREVTFLPRDVNRLNP